ncbi:molybdopterin biosynthesis protein, partial [Desulfovibrio sp. OttesenSCG-928-M16]|nr:molybdopterin biosynthesis protein [Desulfovibrio sp. OttesenSCG-928-M16]
MQQKQYRSLMSLEQAAQTWIDKLDAREASPLAVEKVPLAQARGRTLALPEAARVSSPAFHGAAMDGIAVRAEDTFGASTHRPLTLTLNKNAFWINTGRPLPQECNAVIMSEQVLPGQGDAVIIEQAAYPWQHVRKVGEDMVATEIILPPGTLIGAYELGALAVSGVYEPRVFARPKVAVIPSGSELVPLKEATPELLARGNKIPEFNSLILSALIEDVGGEPLIFPIVPDEPELIHKALEQAAGQADLLLIIAGSSAGNRDFTAEIIAENGELWVHGVALMPGKPTALGSIFGKPFLGAPGYPISSIIAFEEFGQKLLALWQKRSPPARPVGVARPYQALPSKPGLEERVRVKLGKVDDTLFAVPLPRGAGTMTSLSRADGIMPIPAASEGLDATRSFSVTLLRDRTQIDGALLAIGSHDNTLEMLDSFLRRHFPPYSLASAHVGSLGGLMALKNKQCHLAGSHLLDPESGLYNQAALRENLADIPVRLMRLVDREQGLIVAKGNPLGIKDISDLAGAGVLFVNRQRGSGTRVLLDWEL